MPLMIEALIFLGVAGAAAAFMPRPAAEFPRMPGQAVLPRTLDGQLTGGRRGTLRSAAGMLGQLVVRWSPQQQERRGQLVDISSNLTVEEFQGLKIAGAGGAILLAAIVMHEFGEPPMMAMALAGMTGFFAPDVWLRQRIAKRHQAILRSLPEVIDLLSLCIGAGLDFLGALNKVIALKSTQKDPLIQELSGVVQEIRLGKRRAEALRAMAKRVNLAPLSSFVRTLVQADRMGTPMGDVLVVHTEDLRFERFTRAERLALKAPIKILLPLIFCILPSVALIVGAPILMPLMTQNPLGK